MLKQNEITELQLNVLLQDILISTTPLKVLQKTLWKALKGCIVYLVNS